MNNESPIFPVAPVVTAAKPFNPLVTWEYKEVNPSSWKDGGVLSAKQLNELGRQGWELCGFTKTFAEFGYIYIFKRPTHVFQKCECVEHGPSGNYKDSTNCPLHKRDKF
jgi:hypothetical protein